MFAAARQRELAGMVQLDEAALLGQAGYASDGARSAGTSREAMSSRL